MRLVRRLSFARPIALGLAIGLTSGRAGADGGARGETAETRRLEQQMVALMEAGRYSEVQPIADKRLELLEKALGPDAIGLVNAIGDAAKFRWKIGDLRNAAELYQRAISVLEKNKGVTPEFVANSRMEWNLFDYAKALDALGDVYREEGDYARAEATYQRLLPFWRDADKYNESPEDTSIPPTLEKLAALHEDERDYAGAEAFLTRALEIRKRLHKPDDVSIGVSQKNLGSFYRRRGDAARAEPALKEALRIMEKENGPASREVAEVALELGRLYGSQRAYAKAAPLLDRAFSIRNDDEYGTPRDVVGQTIRAWAQICFDSGEIPCADAKAEAALAALKKALGPRHREVGAALFTRSDVRAAEGRTSEAIADAREAEEIEDSDIEGILMVGSEAQKRARLADEEDRTAAIVSLHAVAAPTDPAAADLALTAILRRKGLVLDAVADGFSILRAHQDPAGKALLDQLATVSTQLAAQSARGPDGVPPAQYQKNLDALAAERRRLEEDIGRKSAEFRADRGPLKIAEIQALIPADAALVEILAYRAFHAKDPPDKRWGDRRYAAYVLRSTGPIGFADLGAVAPIDAAASAFHDALEHIKSDHPPRPPARDLDARVMQPIRPLIGDARQILLSSDGALNLVPFAALVGEDGRFLVERYTFTTLTSGRDLIRFAHATPPRSSDVVILADPAYDARTAAAPAGHRGLVAAGMPRMRFSPLPASAEEARSIARLIPGARVILGAEATEAAVRGVRHPRVLHIATNGFFLPPPPADAAPESPLLHAGLALAGANALSSGADDGILTALEAASLDLYGTRLVVLSACETGLGNATLGEGVYGLRRALVIAGAETQILSLWDVLDAPTETLMKRYYARLVRGEGRSEALRQAALEMLAQPDTAHPNLWAGFIVSGDATTLEGAPAPPPPIQVHARGCGCEIASDGAGAAGIAAIAILAITAAARRRRSRADRLLPSGRGV